MKKYITVFILVAISCTPADKFSEARKVYDESMVIHDEIMPKMDDLFTLRQKLSKQIDSLKVDTLSNKNKIIENREVLRDLATADKAMMDWMHDTQDIPGNTDSEKFTGEEILKVQKDQKATIERVRDDMEQAIKKAQELLTKNAKP